MPHGTFAGVDKPFDRAAYRARLRLMSDNRLKEEGRANREMTKPSFIPVRQVWIDQLAECKAEWRERYGIMKAASGRRYSEMTEEEFEAEAKRGSAMGAAVGGLQKIIDPGHSTECIVEQEQRIEAERTNSRDRPESGLPPKPY